MAERKGGVPVSVVAEPTPIERLERLISIADPVTGDGRKIVADARKALAEVEAVVAAAWRDHRDATGHLRPGEFGVVNLNTYASMGCKSCIALVPFGKEGS